MDYDDLNEQGNSSDHSVDYDEQNEYYEGETVESFESGYQIDGGDGSNMSDEELMASALAEVQNSQRSGWADDHSVQGKAKARDQYKNAYGKEASFEDYKGIDAGDTAQYGGTTAKDFMLRKIGHMGYSQQAAFREVALGNSLSSMPGIDGQSMEVAMNEFTRVTGVSGKEFASGIHLDGSVVASKYPQDLRTVHSMLINIAEDMEQGPGTKLIGSQTSKEKREFNEMSEQEAYATLDELVEMTKGGITGQPGEANYTRAVKDKIYGAALNSSAGLGSTAWVPLPSTLNMFGSVLNMSPYGTETGTGYDRQSFSENFPHLLDKPEYGETDVNGQVIPFTARLRPDLAAELERSRKTGIYSQNPELKEYMANVPSLKSTYMPKPSGFNDMDFDSREAWKAERDANWEVFNDRLGRARKTLVRLNDLASPYERATDVDSFGMPSNEQATRMNAINEAMVYGVEDNALQVNSPSVEALVAGPGKGSDRGGMYGLNDLTERSQFVELSLEGMSTDQALHYQDTGERPEDMPKSFADTDQGRYQMWVDNSGQGRPEQGSARWHAQRRGNITASQADKLGTEKGMGSLAENLAKERMGKEGAWRKNAMMQRGNDLEEKAKNKFLQWHSNETGEPLTWEEAYFETNENLPGLGVSPDGRMFDADGNSQGLLEIKVLKAKNLAGARSKYNRQMQLQMAVTGETQTHFWAMDAEGSEDFVYETVYADPEMQHEMIQTAREAQKLSGELITIEDVEAHRMARIQSKQPRNSSASHKQGQQDGWEEEVEAQHVAAPWKRDWEASVGLSNDGEKVTSANSAYAKANSVMGKRDAKAAAQDAEDALMNADGVQSPRQIRDLEKQAKDVRSMAKAEYAAYDEDKKREAKATQAATAALKDFEKGVKTAANSLGEIGRLAMSGTSSAMDTVRFAAEAGMDEDNVRGLKDAMMEGGLSDEGSNRVMNAAAEQTRTARNLQTGSAAWADIQKFKATAESTSAIRDMDVGSLDNYRKMDPQARVAWMQNMVKDMGVEDKARTLDYFKAGELAVLRNTTAEDLSTATKELNGEAAIDTNKGEVLQREVNRDLLEKTNLEGEAGELVGRASVVADNTSSVVNSVTGSALIGAATGAIATKVAGGGAMAALATGASTAGAALTALATPLIALTGALGLGVAGGTAINSLIEGSSFADEANDVIGGGVNSIAAAFGNKDAQAVQKLHNIDRGVVGRGASAGRLAPVTNVEVNTVVDKNGDTETVVNTSAKEYTDDAPNNMTTSKRTRGMSR